MFHAPRLALRLTGRDGRQDDSSALPGVRLPPDEDAVTTVGTTLRPAARPRAALDCADPFV
ncbi:hypothetical protein [Streptosporangium lutulentum]|uniref:Uncharacterized protein n=1 Tax=Streptosporangium lutulentum TaxID=1461250 RepID=A0ABT9QB44_9ACTN|nr:hypothetical protein [Streptosporangium lutulentum]MDP9844001.1 hypothetical protein [Streptosporangium lutulentum]